MLHETEPAAGGIPEEIQHLDFVVNCLSTHTQPTLAEYQLECRHCGAISVLCESHYNQILANLRFADVQCTRCLTAGPLGKVFRPTHLGGALA